MKNNLTEDITINNSTYQFASNYKDNNSLRKGFNTLALKCFDFELEDFYQKGYWDDRYIPYSIISDGQVVSNVSVFIFEFLLKTESIQCVQIATAMTDINYRNRGLCKYLLNRVIHEWKNGCDMIYLFANNSAIELYPKFGFYPAQEYVHSTEKLLVGARADIVKLNMSLEKDQERVINYIHNTVPVSGFSPLHAPSLIIYYCITSYCNNIYYLPELDSMVIFEIKDTILYVYDIFCKKHIDLADIIKRLSTNNVKRVILGFSPLNKNSFDEEVLKIENSTLMILGDQKSILSNYAIRFPVLTRT
jgi:hypothetical protein